MFCSFFFLIYNECIKFFKLIKKSSFSRASNFTWKHIFLFLRRIRRKKEKKEGRKIEKLLTRGSLNFMRWQIRFDFFFLSKFASISLSLINTADSLLNRRHSNLIVQFNVTRFVIFCITARNIINRNLLMKCNLWEFCIATDSSTIQ